MKLHCTITTPEMLLYDGDVRMVVVPASDGELGILPRHAPLMALLGTGELRLVLDAGRHEWFFIQGGFVHVVDNRVDVLATEAQLAAKIDRAAALDELEKLRAQPATGLTAEEFAERERRLHAAWLRSRVARG